MEPTSHPLTVAQREFWFGEALRPASGNMSGTVTTTGRVDVGRTRDAVATLIERHEALRTSFHRARGSTLQAVAPPANLQVEQVEIRSVDLRGRPSTTVDTEVDELIAELHDEPFDLERPPALRLAVVRRPDFTSTVVLVTHHIVSDNWSMKVLWRELFAAYQGGASALDDVPTSTATMARRAAWEQERASSGAWTRTADRASATLRGAACPPLGDRRRSGSTTALDVVLTPEGVAALDRARGAFKATPFALAFTVIVRSIARALGRDDLVVFVPVSNRDAENWNAVGLFANTVPTRLAWNPGVALATQVGEARRRLAGAVADGGLPLGTLARALDVHTRRDVLGDDRLRVMVRQIGADPATTRAASGPAHHRGPGAGRAGQNPGLATDLLVEVGQSRWTATSDDGTVAATLVAEIMESAARQIAEV